jgi:hypothetical protein
MDGGSSRAQRLSCREQLHYMRGYLAPLLLPSDDPATTLRFQTDFQTWEPMSALLAAELS